MKEVVEQKLTAELQKAMEDASAEMSDAIMRALYSPDPKYAAKKESWARKLLERFCRWLMAKLDIEEEY